MREQNEMNKGGFAQQSAISEEIKKPPKPKKFPIRVAFGAWVNDMRNVPTPKQGWPYGVIDEQTVSDVMANLKIQADAGFNYVDIAGLLTTFSWPLDIVSAIDEQRRQRINQIIDEAHRYGMKVITFPGMFSWGFDEIIRQRPGVRGNSQAAMCASREESWEWQFRVLDYVLENFKKLDGIHIESGDRYRCTCERCEGTGHNAYLTGIDLRIADYIKQKAPKKTVFVNTCGYRPWNTPEDTACIQELSEHVDFIITPNWWHERPDLGAKERKAFISSLACPFGSSAGFWVYPPQRWNRLKWFLPYPQTTGAHIRQLYAEGGRAAEYYMGPVINPGVEFNIAFGGRMLSRPDAPVEEIMFETANALYTPRNDRICRELVRLFARAEDAYLSNNRHRSGELRLTHLWGTEPGPECYLSTYDEGGAGWVLMEKAGQEAYKRELNLILKDMPVLDNQVGDRSKVFRIRKCIETVIRDLEALNH